MTRSPATHGESGPKVTLLKAATIPLILLGITSAFILLWKTVGLPPPEQLVQSIEALYAEHGLWLVFGGAIAEGLLVVGWYLPGSVVIVLGVVFNQGHPLRAVAAVMVVIAAFLITSIINYVLGRFGWYAIFRRFGLSKHLDKARSKVLSEGPSWIVLTYFHPNVGSLTATACGILRIRYDVFILYTVAALVLWNAVWGFLAYYVGRAALRFLDLRWLVVFGVLWLGIAVVAHLLKTQRSR